MPVDSHKFFKTDRLFFKRIGLVNCNIEKDSKGVRWGYELFLQSIIYLMKLKERVTENNINEIPGGKQLEWEQRLFVFYNSI